MKLGIIGYGKMGKEVERQASIKDHSCVILSIPAIAEQLQKERIDCAIDFSHADVAIDAILTCLEAGISVVSGTTGWNERLPEVIASARKHETGFCWAPNFSLGMHITFHLNRVLADIMNRYPEYTPSMLEIHHTEKKDSPSGTAIALAGQIIERIDRIREWRETESDVPSDTLPIEARREFDVKGIHRVSYQGPHDTISIRHHALSRDGFAAGAVLAAEKLKGKIGYHAFEELLGFRAKS